jgi:nucleotide-binding universal stress UspA family protein
MSLENKRILLPVDVAEVPVLALAQAREILGPHEVSHVVAVMSGWEQTSAAFNWGTIDGESREAYAARSLGQRLAGTPYADATFHVVFGDPAEQITRMASELGIDLILLPCRNRQGRLQRLVKGSVAESVVRLSPCPVLVLPMNPEAPPATKGPPMEPPFSGHRGAW